MSAVLQSSSAHSEKSEGLRARLAQRMSPVQLPQLRRFDTSLKQFQVLAVNTTDLEVLFPKLLHSEVHELRLSAISEDSLDFGSRRISVDVCVLEAPVEEFPAEALSVPKVWADLFRPLTAPRNVGRHYAEQSFEEATAPVNPATPHVSRHQGFRQAFVERKPGGRVNPQRMMSVWDRILPLLQPPLELDFPHTLDLPDALRPYQVDGVKFLLEHECALLGDDMGTGKTVQATVAMRILFQTGTISSALIVCPLSVLGHWDRHLERWAPLLSPNVVRGMKERRQGIWKLPAHVWITTYDTLRLDIELLLEERGTDAFDLVVLDEVQKIKNPGTGYSKAVNQLSPKYRWGFSGTPVENRLEDLLSIFHFIRPGLFSRGRAYYGNEEASRKIAPFFLRRRKSDVLKDLPQKIEFEEWLSLDGAQRDAYETAEREGKVYLTQLGSEITVQHILALLTRLKQICNVDPKSSESAKTTWLHDFVEDISESEDKAVIFSQYLDWGIHWLSRQLAANHPSVYVGGLSAGQREAVLKKFRSDPESKVMLISRAGGLGLDLTAANYVVHFDHWWNPATVRQAEDRVHRFGQSKKVFVYHLWIQDTVEEKIYRILEKKQNLYADTIDVLSNVEGTGLSEDELFGLFGLQSPKKRSAGKDLAAWTGVVLTDVSDFQLLTPESFEDLVANLFSKKGYGVRKTPVTRDQGIDIIATREKESVAGVERIAIQCKRYEHPVGEPVARNLLGALAADPSFAKGIIVTNSSYTADCRSFCERNGRIELVDGNMLLTWVRRFLSHQE